MEEYSTYLSAGRVQSVAVRSIVEKEREIERHIPTSSFKVSGIFSDEKISFARGF